MGHVNRLVSFVSSFLILFSANAFAATYYVATDGSDSASGSSEAPFQSIGHGISQMSSGDTLIVRDGTYYDKDNFITGMPAGTAEDYTEIKAENPLNVRIVNTQGLAYYDHVIRIQANYVHVDGFIAEIVDSNYPPFVGSVSGNYNKVTNAIFKRKGRVDQYGGWLSLSGNNNLAEDVAGVGSARYGFYTGSSNSSVKYNIFRRAVGRVDYTESTQPKAVFAMYGNNSGTEAEHHLFQNCIAIDSHRGPRSPQETYGGFYFPKNADHTKIQGSISLNNDVAYAGYFVKELQGQNIVVENSVSWANYNDANATAGIRFGGSYGPLTMTNLTVGDHNMGYYNNSSGAQSLFDSLIYFNDREGNNDYFAEKSNNIIELLATPAIDYIVMPSDSGQGADVTKRYGASGTIWGETGYDQMTNEDLWPWPNEDKIKEVFSEENNPPTGVGIVPESNDTTRGFTEPGSDQWGQAITLTRYIWQYLGNKIPDEIYAGGAGDGADPVVSAPLPPSGFSVSVQ